MRIDSIVDDIVNRHIHSVHDLCIEHLSYIYDINIAINHDVNCYIEYDNTKIIMLKSSNTFKMWHSFCHEFGHMIMHDTHQQQMPRMFNEYQEFQANRFALLLMMPKKLILKNELYDAKEVSVFFHVPFDLALNRLEILANQLKIDME